MRAPQPQGLLPVLLLLLLCPGCVALSPSKGGGQTDAPPARRIEPRDIALPAGYRIEAVATGLTYPSSVTFDADNRPHVLEAGYSYGEDFRRGRLLRVEPDGSTREVLASDEGVPWTGVDFHNGAFFIAQGGEITGGRIVRVNADGSQPRVLIAGLPTRGDHHTNGPAIGPDGSIYFGVGTATNSGVVGPDNFKYGWLKRFPDLHDVPPKDVKLTGQNFKTRNPLTEAPDDEVETGAFVPFGTPTQPGQTVRGRMPCNGAVLRIRPDRAGGGGGSGAAEPEVVAWGMRNPFGLRFAPGGSLFVVENSYDVRGSRPVWGAGDLLWRVDEPGTWYGWPDFHGGEPLTWQDHFRASGHAKPEFLLAEHPNPPPRPVAKLDVHGGAGGLDFSRDGAFGFAGHAFVALFGDLAPEVGKVLKPVGYKILRVEPDSGAIHAFAVNRGATNGPASRLKSGGFERPLDVRFDGTGRALYVVDFGVMLMEKSGPRPQPGTGVLWRITREAQP